MEERWFSQDELEEMARPTMDRAIEAIERGDSEAAKALCEEMKREWQLLHDLMAGGMAGLVSFVQDRLGDDGVEEAWEYSLERGWQVARGGDRRSRTAAGWCTRWPPTGARTRAAAPGPNPGAFTITEDEEKFTFAMNPCGSGQRLWRNGAYEGPERIRRHERGARLELRTRGLPAYCTHCSFMNELLPMRWTGLPVYPSDPPDDFDRDPCVWYWYKDPADIPARHRERYGEFR